MASRKTIDELIENINEDIEKVGSMRRYLYSNLLKIIFIFGRGNCVFLVLILMLNLGNHMEKNLKNGLNIG